MTDNICSDYISNDTFDWDLNNNLYLVPKFSGVIKNLVFGSGSVKGISIIGALAKMQDMGFIDIKNIQKVSGSSVGAIIACLITIGYNTEKLWNFFKDTPLDKYVTPDTENMPLELVTRYGICNGDEFLEFTNQLICDFMEVNTNVTFLELYNRTKIELTITGTCITTKKLEYFNHIITPGMSVALAIRISSSIPFYFSPVLYEDKYYIDGGVLDDHPMKIFKDEYEVTIGFAIYSAFECTIDCFENYLIAMLDTITFNYINKTKKYENVLYIHNEIILNPVNFAFTSLEDKIKLYVQGVNQAREFVRKQRTYIRNNT